MFWRGALRRRRGPTGAARLRAASAVRGAARAARRGIDASTQKVGRSPPRAAALQNGSNGRLGRLGIRELQ